jgi:hypothetical protein
MVIFEWISSIGSIAVACLIVARYWKNHGRDQWWWQLMVAGAALVYGIELLGEQIIKLTLP